MLLLVCILLSRPYSPLSGSEIRNTDEGEATFVLHCRWTGPSNRSFDIESVGGVRVHSLFQPTDSPPDRQSSPSADSPRTIHVRTPQPGDSLLVELRCFVGREGVLSVRVREGDRDLGVHRFNIEELLRERRVVELPGEAGSLALWRKPGDELRIQPLHPHLVFFESQMFRATADFNFGSRPDRKSRFALGWTIREARSDRDLNSGSVPFSIPRRNNSSFLRQSFSLIVPDREGAFDLQVSLENESGRILAKTTVPFVVHSGSQNSPGNVESPPARRLASVVHDPRQLLDSIEDRGQSLEGNRTLTDWHTMLRFAKLAGDRVERTGMNSMVLGINSGGAALYPTNSVSEDSVRLDNGRCAPESPDPVPKDVVELLFREFDRRNLTLIPEIDLTDRDPILERLPREPERTGDSSERGANPSSGPRYDILTTTVQNRALEILQEILGRYGHHHSFGGVSLAIHDGNWLCLTSPDDDAGGLPDSLQTVSPLDAPDHRTALRERMETHDGPEERTEKLAARCRQMADFYHRLAEIVARTGPAARLYLSPDRLVASGRFQREVLDVLHAGRSLDSLLAIRGIEPRLLQSNERIALLHPFCHSIDSLSGAERLAIAGINSSAAFNQSEFPWCGFVDVPSRSATAETLSGSRESLDRFLSHALSGLDSGPLFIDDRNLPRQNEGSGILELVRKLPPVTFEQIPDPQQPIAIRRIRHNDRTWLLAVNDSPLPTEVAFRVKSDEASSIEPLDSDSNIEETRIEGDRVWKWKFGAFSAKGACCGSHRFEIVELKTLVDPVALADLKKRVGQLDSLVGSSEFRAAPERLPLMNADFEKETTAGTLPPGWNYRYGRSVPPRLDLTSPHSGKNCLALEKQLAAQPVGISTLPFSIEKARHLTISFWGKSDSSDLSLSLEVTGKHAGNPWTRTVVVRPDRRWQQFVFRVFDIPEDFSEPTFGIRLNEPGKLLLDDFEIFPRRLTPDDERKLMRALATIRLAWQQERYADCVRLIDGYWGRILTDLPEVSVNRDLPLPQVGSRFRDLIVR